ncbi:hypothetical protein Fmac_001429 [Flemingia macrophylla]|uniref:Uncharacterized protein n=1 Tax=Flemingia macrophylla TaxID=520843 RepID=A0ABD1NH35_9FABA
MRQLMRTQIVPYKEELGGLCFFYDPDHQDEMRAICRAWEKPIYIGDGELGKARVSVFSDYEECRTRRGAPQPSTSHAPTSADKELQGNVDALTKKLEIMGAQLRALEDKDEESSLIIDDLRRQCKKKDQEIEQLKDECANINEKVTQAANIPKIDPGSQFQEIIAKIAHLEAEHAKQAQLIKMMQEDLTLTRFEAQRCISQDKFKGIVSHIIANDHLTFTDEKIPPEGPKHNKPLHIFVKCKEYLIAKVLIDNGSSLNVMPKRTLEQVSINGVQMSPSNTIVRTFDGSKREVVGEINLPIQIRPTIFNMEFQVMDITLVYNCS